MRALVPFLASLSLGRNLDHYARFQASQKLAAAGPSALSRDGLTNASSFPSSSRVIQNHTL